MNEKIFNGIIVIVVAILSWFLSVFYSKRRTTDNYRDDAKRTAGINKELSDRVKQSERNYKKAAEVIRQIRNSKEDNNSSSSN